MKKIISKIILIFLYSQPFLDIIAGLLLNNGYTNYISSTLRIIFFLFVILCLLFTKYKDKKKTLIYLFCLSLYFICFMINKNALFIELKSSINSFYFIIMLLAFYNLKTNISSKHLRNLLIIYSLLIFIPNILNLGFNSYEYERVGYSGLFYSANSVGTLLVLLFASSIEKLKKDNKYLTIITVAILTYSLFTLGTKTSLLGLFLILLINIIYYIIKSFKNKKKFYSLLVALAIVISIFILVFPKTYVYKNYQIYVDYLEEKGIEKGSIEYYDNIIFSKRIECLRNERASYINSNIYEKLFGMGYTKEPVKLAEMDYFDILYRNGVIGFILYVAVLIYMAINYIKYNKGLNDRVLIILILVLALLSGHIFTSPSISIFVALMMNKRSND